MRRLYPSGLGPLSDVPRTGPSPVMARVKEWLRVLPRWESYAAQVRLALPLQLPASSACQPQTVNNYCVIAFNLLQIYLFQCLLCSTTD
jgi:hypothetical protein